jgi:hypothetical protein
MGHNRLQHVTEVLNIFIIYRVPENLQYLNTVHIQMLTRFSFIHRTFRHVSANFDHAQRKLYVKCKICSRYKHGLHASTS